MSLLKDSWGNQYRPVPAFELAARQAEKKIYGEADMSDLINPATDAEAALEKRFETDETLQNARDGLRELAGQRAPALIEQIVLAFYAAGVDDMQDFQIQEQLKRVGDDKAS